MLISPGAPAIVSVLSTHLKGEKCNWLFLPGLLPGTPGGVNGRFQSFCDLRISPRSFLELQVLRHTGKESLLPPDPVVISQHLRAPDSQGAYLFGQPSALVIFEPIFKSRKL